MLLPTLHVHQRDEPLVLRALEVCHHLDGTLDADLLLVHPDTYDISRVASAASTAFKRIHTECYPDWTGDTTWPKPQNWAWQRTARLVRQRFEGKSFVAWLWWESDALPVRKGWLTALTDAYKSRPRALFSGVPCSTFSQSTYMNGVGLYPINTIDPLANCSALYDLNIPFDIAAGSEVCKSFKPLTPLLQHFPKSQGGSFGTTFTELPQEAVFVHGCTDGSLHDLVTGKRHTLQVRSMPGRSTFYHSGDLGDVIYSLPAVRELGGGDLSLGPDNRSGMSTRVKMDARNAALLLPLLEVQPYLHTATFSATLPLTTTYDLNSMRLLLRDYRLDMQQGYNLARCYLRTFGLALTNDEPAWLHIDQPRALAPVIINRSSRYQNSTFRWDRVLDAYKGGILFLGHPEEHAAFCKQWQCKIPYEPTSNLLEAARLIAGAQLFIGNQSCCYAIAEGLKKAAILETCPSGSNTLFSRRNLLHNVDAKTPLPVLQGISKPRHPLKSHLSIIGPVDTFTGLGRITSSLAAELSKSFTISLQPSSLDKRLPVPRSTLSLLYKPAPPSTPRLLVLPLLSLRTHIQPGDTVLTMWESTVLPPGAADTLNTYASQLIVPSSWCATVFSANGVTIPIHIVPLGIDTSIYKPGKRKPSTTLRFGAAGRLAHGGRRKGIEDTITAFTTAFPAGTEATTLELKLFDDCALPATTDPRIKVLTTLLTDKQMADWYRSLDCFVSLSKGEGWGLHVQEAIACGTPVIAPSYSGLADLVTDGVHYTIIPATEGYLGHWCQPSIEQVATYMQRAALGKDLYLNINRTSSMCITGMSTSIQQVLQ